MNKILWAAIIFYLFYFYFYRIFEKRQLVKYLILSICSSAALTFLLMPLHKIFYPDFEIFNCRYLIPPTFGTFIIAQSGCLVSGFENWINNLKQQIEIENLYLKTENELIKSQIAPHLLFNTLNNIDSFIHSQPKKASETLISLSQILRYTIYETKEEFVPLSKEIEYINNYINLKKIRISDPDAIKVNLPISCDNIFIPPLIFLPFLKTHSSMAYIRIKEILLKLALIAQTTK